MRAMGDETLPPFVLTADGVDFNINESYPLTSQNYTSGMVTYSYRWRENGDLDLLEFSNDGASWESLVPKVNVKTVSFALSGNTLTVSLEGTYNDADLTFYSACYPRLASF